MTPDTPLTIDFEALVATATAAAQHAYSPYSGYAVGAALLGEDRVIYSGCNIENAAYPAGICAERVALVKAVSVGVQRFRALVVVTRDGGSPCGICRQMLSEFAPTLPVALADGQGRILVRTTLDQLLPLAFRPDNLRNDDLP